ncbi:MAG: hypothetical protein GY715_03965 [Planctomycetes bacterium]|nr:hypothetical protein [Planctomycetota bacterium]
MTIVLLILAGGGAMPVLSGCADSTYASPEGKSPPYILKEGCTFSIIGENGRAGVGSPKVTGMAAENASASTSFGEYSITVSNCTLIENSHDLPVFED